MGKEMHELREMLVDELHKITSKGELTAGSLETVDKLTHSIKSIDTICAMEEAGYSKDYSRPADNYAYSYGRRRGYARAEHEDLVSSLRGLMEGTTDNKSRMVIQRAIEQMEA